MTEQTRPNIRADYDASAFRIHIVSDNKLIEEIPVTRILFQAEISGVRTGPLSEFAAGPLTRALQNFPLDKALTQALVEAEASQQGYSMPVYTGPDAQAYE